MYKTVMKAAPHIHAQIAAPWTDSGVIVDSDHCDCYQAYHRVPEAGPVMQVMQQFLKLMQDYFPPPTFVAQRYFQRLQPHLPPWIGGPKPVTLDASAQPLTEMLRALKLATEIYLGAEISNATLSVPFPIGRGRADSYSLEKRLDAAASVLNLKLSLPIVALSEITLEDLKAKQRKRSPYTYFSCHPDDEGFVLGIEFNDAALTATIQDPDCGDGDYSFYIKRILHSTDLGARELFEADNWRDTLVDALHRVTTKQIKGVAESNQINMLVLLGDSAWDERLHHALEVILGDQYDRLIASAKDDGTPARDPQFRGAASAAHSNWHRSQYWTETDEYGCVPPGPHYLWFPPKMYSHMMEAWETICEWFRSAEDKKAEVELAAEQERKRLLRELGRQPIAIGPA